ncbi:MAG: serine hydroxymethyltransferase [Candidatus Moraniibacteriota bacterium]|nr:MAG: serine hydroxymethyltransferase [Candidatus Moranbacteria bacterium]
MKHLKKNDTAVYSIIQGELKRQKEGLELIASENYVSEAVLEALGSVMTNKYSEGYPGMRYYGGQEFTDKIENLAIERAKKLFSAQHVNIQPHSGAPANMIVYSALLEPGDTVLGMDLGHGGHLTHGHPVTLSAKMYNFVRYKTEKDGKIDYDKLLKLAKKHKPKIILAGFSSYSRNLSYAKFRKIANEVNAILMMDMAHIAGLVAGKVLSNPVRICDIVTTTTHKTLRGPRGGMILCKKKYAKAIDKATFPGFQGGPHMNNTAAKAVALGEALKPSFQKYAKQILANAKVMEKELKKYGFIICFGKTENHMMLIDTVSSKNLTGKQVETVLDEIGITLNKNMIPDDPRSPFDPSGIRLGVAAMTTRGMKEKEMIIVAKWINDACDNIKNKKELRRMHKEIVQMCKKFPLYS